jgi:putative transposase
MANHVHVLLLPLVSPPKLLQALKGATARFANLALGRTGQPFWQAESYDHWARDQDEFDRILAYIENNPVKAGLVIRPEHFRWSSASIPIPETATDVARTRASAASPAPGDA